MTQPTTLNSHATPYGNIAHETYGDPMQSFFTFYRTDGKNEPLTRAQVDQLPPTEVGGLFLSSVVERLKADSLPKDSVL